MHPGAGRRHSMKSKSHRYFLPSPWGIVYWMWQWLEWWVVVSHGSRVTGQLS